MDTRKIDPGSYGTTHSSPSRLHLSHFHPPSLQLCGALRHLFALKVRSRYTIARIRCIATFFDPQVHVPAPIETLCPLQGASSGWFRELLIGESGEAVVAVAVCSRATRCCSSQEEVSSRQGRPSVRYSPRERISARIKRGDNSATSIHNELTVAGSRAYASGPACELVTGIRKGCQCHLCAFRK
jgi:hypothetical protein